LNMKPRLKIKFVDFWQGFVPEESYFFDLFGGDQFVEISENPQILFFSNFGVEHKKYYCFRVYFSSENERPNMFKSDVALTSDYNSNKRHFRLPLFVIYLHQYKIDIHNFNSGISMKEVNEWKNRKFCCFIVSNGKSKKRVDFFRFLSNQERIDSGGRFMNNIHGPVENKLDFIRDYKFVIAFENSSYPGYITEKILEPFLTNSIPIYWGDPKVFKDFNIDAFLNVSAKANFKDVYSLMKNIESSDELIFKILSSHKFDVNIAYLNKNKVRDFILQKFYQSSRPISKKIIFKAIAHFFDIFQTIKYWLKHYTIGNFR
jgi:hypothetical protein